MTNGKSYSIELIKTGRDILLSQRPDKEWNFDPIQSLLVYCLVPIQDGYLPINRDYKPLGISRYFPWAEYEQYPFLVIPKEKVNVAHCEKQNSTFYLFTDLTYPHDKKKKDRYVEMLKKTFTDLNE